MSRSTGHIVHSLYVHHSFLVYSYSLVVYPSFSEVLVYLVFRLAFLVVFVKPEEVVFVRVSSRRTGRANGEHHSLFVFRVRVRFSVIVFSPLGPVVVITFFLFLLFVSLVLFSHFIGHVDAYIEVRRTGFVCNRRYVSLLQSPCDRSRCFVDNR